MNTRQNLLSPLAHLGPTHVQRGLCVHTSFYTIYAYMHSGAYSIVTAHIRYTHMSPVSHCAQCTITVRNCTAGPCVYYR
jgi:hypothetical protein